MRYDTVLASGLADLAMRIGVVTTNIELEGAYGGLEPLQSRFGLLKRGGIEHGELSQIVQNLRDGQPVVEEKEDKEGKERKIVESLMATEGRIWGALATHDASLPEEQRERLQRLVSGQGDFSSLGVLEAHRWIRAPFLRGLLAPDEKLESEVKTTPLLHFPKLSQGGRQVFIKMEGLQRSGSLKVRGATYVLAAARILGRSPSKTCVVTAAQGNDAFALVTAAKNLGYMHVEVALPRSVSVEKEVKLRKLGAKVIRLPCETFEQADERMSKLFKDDPGVLYVSRFDHPDYAMAVATLAFEIDIQMNRKNHISQYVVLAPAGTGGLLAGVGTYFEGQNIPVFGVQSKNYSNLTESFRLKKRICSTPTGKHQKTAADSIAIETVGPKTFDAVLRSVTAMAAISEEEIHEAMANMHDAGFTWEGASALTAAAVRSGVFDEYFPPNMPMVAVHTGENIDPMRHDYMVHMGHRSQEMRAIAEEHAKTTKPAPAPSGNVAGRSLLSVSGADPHKSTIPPKS